MFRLSEYKHMLHWVYDKALKELSLSFSAICTAPKNTAGMACGASCGPAKAASWTGVPVARRRLRPTGCLYLPPRTDPGRMLG